MASMGSLFTFHLKHKHLSTSDESIYMYKYTMKFISNILQEIAKPYFVTQLIKYKEV